MTDGTADTADPMLVAVLNLARFHREHEQYYASAPREQAVVLQRHARTLQALADRWDTVEPSTRSALSPYEGAEDLNTPAATQLDGVLFLEGEGRPAEVARIVRDLRTAGEDAVASGGWLASAMQASWDMAAGLVEVDGLAGVLGERHRIIANDWQAAGLVTLAGRVLQRAADVLDSTELTPAAVRASLTGARTCVARMYSVAEMVDHAADLLSEAAGVQHDSERRWRVFRASVAAVVGRQRAERTRQRA